MNTTPVWQRLAAAANHIRSSDLARIAHGTLCWHAEPGPDHGWQVNVNPQHADGEPFDETWHLIEGLPQPVAELVAHAPQDLVELCTTVDRIVTEHVAAVGKIEAELSRGPARLGDWVRMDTLVFALNAVQGSTFNGYIGWREEQDRRAAVA